MGTVQKISAVLMILVLAGCATAPADRIPTYNPNVPPEIMRADQIACDQEARELAGQSPSNTAAGAVSGAAVGAVIGAGLGALVGVIFRDPGGFAAAGAAIGGPEGLVQGGAAGAQADVNLIDNYYKACMVSRGYMVQ